MRRFTGPRRRSRASRGNLLHRTRPCDGVQENSRRRYEMSKELLGKLQILEEDYVNQPLVVQQVDLREINRLRSQLGMPLVDARLKTIGAGEEEAKPTPKPKPQKVLDHTEARGIYQAYLKKIEELEVHRAYAERVAKATGGPGQTPVRPLATMGTDGGPLCATTAGSRSSWRAGRFTESVRTSPGSRTPVPTGCLGFSAAWSSRSQSTVRFGFTTAIQVAITSFAATWRGEKKRRRRNSYSRARRLRHST